jgi:hypothetical protein
MAIEVVNILIKAKDYATAALKTVSSTLGGIDKQVKQLALTYVSYQAVTGFIKGVVAAAAEEEKQWNKVSAALRMRGRSVDEVLPKIQDMTDELERQRGVSDDLIAESMQRLIIANYSVADSFKTVSLAADITAITGGGLVETVTSLIKGANGSEMQLNRLASSLGINIEKAGTAAEKIELINKQVNGAAQESIKGYQKITNDLAVSWERWSEAVGKGFMDKSAPAIQFLDWWLQKSEEAMRPENDMWARIGHDIDKLYDRLPATKDAVKDIVTTVANAPMSIPKALFGDDPSYPMEVIDRFGIQLADLSNLEFNKVTMSLATLNREFDNLSDLPPIPMSDIYGVGADEDMDLARLRFRQMREGWQETKRAAEEAARAQQRAIEELAGQYRQVLDPLHDWILAGRSISDTFSDMGDRIKSIFVDQIIAAISQAIAKLVIFNGLAGSSGGIGGGGHLLGGILPFGLGNLLPFDNRNNDSMLQREVMWMGQLITRGITAGMQREIPLGQPAAVQSGGATTIHLHFNGPVTSDEFVKDSIIPAIERSASRGHSRIQLRNSKAMGGRYGFGY